MKFRILVLPLASLIPLPALAATYSATATTELPSCRPALYSAAQKAKERALSQCISAEGRSCRLTEGSSSRTFLLDNCDKGVRQLNLLCAVTCSAEAEPR